VSSVFYDKLQSLGIPLPPEEVTESRVVRWGKNKRYWAVRFTGGYALGDWTCGLKDFAFEEGFDHKKCRRQIEKAQRKLTKEKNTGHTEAVVIAQQLWNSASECLTHPYLEKKKIKAHGLRIDRQTLLIPLHDEHGNLISLQKIWPDPKKLGKFIKGFLKGSRLQGNCFTIGEIKDNVVICEGYATGATIHEITGIPVVVAFSSNNLLNITQRVVKNYPQSGVIVAADNDRFKEGNPGLTKAKEAAKSVNVRLVVPEFASDDGEPTDFNDLYVNEGAEKVREAFSSETKEKKETAPDNSEDDSEITDEHLPEGFRLTASALFYLDKRSGPIYLCAYLRVISKTVNIDTNESGKLLEFRTIHGEIKKICMRSKDLFAGHTQTILKDLAGAGLHINLEAPTRKILVYLNNYSPARSIKTTRKSGWCANGFLTENGIITIEEREEDILLDTAYGSTCVAVSGSGDDWRENIGRLCCGNSRLILAASTAFTAPLLHLLDRPNFGIQLVGKSSAGKTTALYVAASVYGPRGYVKSWRATDNGLETVAFNHNDMLLILDEMGEMSPQKIGATVYMLANGVGKTRANTSGDAKQPKTWRIALLSAGEIDLNTHMASVGSAAMAGQNIRLLPVPAVPKDTTGLIENTHGFNMPSAIVKHLITATQRCYGAPLPEYIRLLMQNQEKISDDFQESLENSKEEMLPPHADGQDNRVFDFFFTIGFAGELATEYGLTGWCKGEASDTAITIFKDWVAAKGGFGNQEEKMLLYKLRCFFQKYQYSRFLPINNYDEADETKSLNEFIGYRKNTDAGVTFYAYPERFKDAVQKEINADFGDVIKLADELKILERADHRNLAKLVRIKNKVTRMLVFNNKVLADEG
jgi:putative DNA primase/helicase